MEAGVSVARTDGACLLVFRACVSAPMDLRIAEYQQGTRQAHCNERQIARRGVDIWTALLQMTVPLVHVGCTLSTGKKRD